MTNSLILHINNLTIHYPLLLCLQTEEEESRGNQQNIQPNKTIHVSGSSIDNSSNEE